MHPATVDDVLKTAVALGYRWEAQAPDLRPYLTNWQPLRVWHTCVDFLPCQGPGCAVLVCATRQQAGAAHRADARQGGPYCSPQCQSKAARQRKRARQQEAQP